MEGCGLNDVVIPGCRAFARADRVKAGLYICVVARAQDTVYGLEKKRYVCMSF